MCFKLERRKEREIIRVGVCVCGGGGDFFFFFFFFLIFF